jgi:hypothetical protein
MEKGREPSMIDDFDRQWVDLVKRVERVEALYALIGLTQLGADDSAATGRRSRWS